MERLSKPELCLGQLENLKWTQVLKRMMSDTFELQKCQYKLKTLNEI